MKEKDTPVLLENLKAPLVPLDTESQPSNPISLSVFPLRSSDRTRANRENYSQGDQTQMSNSEQL